VLVSVCLSFLVLSELELSSINSAALHFSQENKEEPSCADFDSAQSVLEIIISMLIK
jgi:hypothetical protein